MRSYNSKNVVGGLAFAAIGLFFVVGALEYDIGSLDRMGPGYFPVSLGLLAIGVGAYIAISGFLQKPSDVVCAWRPLLAVAASMAVFAFLVERLGLVPAVLLMVAVAGLADKAARPLSTLVLAAVLALGSWLIFRQGLGLPMPAFSDVF